MSCLPPGPKLAAEQQTFLWFANPYEFMKRCAAEFGDAFTLELTGTGPHVFFSRPEAIKEIFTADPDAVLPGVSSKVWLPFLGRDSLLLLQGPAHRRERKLLAPAFHMARVQAWGAMIEEEALRASLDWREGEPFSMLSSMEAMAMEIILRAVLGFSGERLREFRKRLRAFLDSVRFAIPTSDRKQGRKLDPWRIIRARVAKLDDVLYAEIAERRASSRSTPDVLSFMMEARYEDGGAMDDAQLRDELLTLVLSGHETTAASLAWSFGWLQKTPAAAQALRRELAAAPLGPLAASRLPYLDAVCKETIRMSPPLPVVTRRLARPLTIAGVSLPEGCNVTPAVYLTHRRPELYPEPDAFRPERFLERRYSAYEFLPFGGGEARCLGADFALFEMKAALATLLRACEFAPMAGPLQAAHRHITMVPAGGPKLTMTRRLAPARAAEEASHAGS